MAAHKYIIGGSTRVKIETRTHMCLPRSTMMLLDTTMYLLPYCRALLILSSTLLPKTCIGLAVENGRWKLDLL